MIHIAMNTPNNRPLSEYKVKKYFFSDEISDFGDTAALCENMDAIVTVDTSVAHLAGALGKKTLILLQYNADWRWMIDRDDSPWYDGVQLLRQNKPNNWDSALIKIQNTLKNILEEQHHDNI